MNPRIALGLLLFVFTAVFTAGGIKAATVNVGSITIPDAQLADIVAWRNGQYSTTKILTSAINAAATTVAMNNTVDIAIGTHILIDNEDLTVTAVAPTSVTVTRGTFQTAAASHVINSQVRVMLYATAADVIKALARIGFRSAISGDAPSLQPKRDAIGAAQLDLESTINGVIQ